MDEYPSVIVVGFCRPLHEKYCTKINRLENKLVDVPEKEREVNVRTVEERLGHPFCFIKSFYSKFNIICCWNVLRMLIM